MARDFTNNLSNYIDIGDVPAIDLVGTAMSIHFWMQLDGVAAQQRIISKWSNATVQQYLIYVTPNKLTFAVSPNDPVTGATALTAGPWYGCGCRKNGSGAGSLEVYINGVSDGTAASTQANLNNSPEVLRFGRGNNVTEQMDGRLAEIAIWDVSLSQDEFAALGKGACPLLIRRDHLKGYWPLLGVAYPEPDLSGNGNHGTQNGTVGAANHAPVGRLAPGVG